MIEPVATALLGSAALQAIVGIAVGGVAGLAYFGALWWNVGLFERGATPRALFVLLSRFAALVLVFVGLVKFGAFALLAGAGGLLVARLLLIRRLGRLE